MQHATCNKPDNMQQTTCNKPDNMQHPEARCKMQRRSDAACSIETCNKENRGHATLQHDTSICNMQLAASHLGSMEAALTMPNTSTVYVTHGTRKHAPYTNAAALRHCNMRRVKCKLQHATCKMQHATCSVQNAACNMQRATRSIIQPALLQRATCPHSPSHRQHARAPCGVVRNP